MANKKSFGDSPLFPGEIGDSNFILKIANPGESGAEDGGSPAFPEETMGKSPKKEKKKYTLVTRQKPDKKGRLHASYYITDRILAALDKRARSDQTLDVSGHVRAALTDYLAKELKELDDYEIVFVTR